MDAVHFLNLEYFVLLVYRIFTGTNINISQIPTQTLQLITDIAWVGLGLSFLFLIGFIYAKMQLHTVEHAGWHKRREEEALAHKDVHAPKNPQWEHVLLLAGSAVEGDWRRAIIEADIMLGNLLESRGYAGATIGDKLKGASPIQFTTLDLAWTAHKVRNDIAHGGEQFHLTERDTKATIDKYRRVFEEFDYL